MQTIHARRWTLRLDSTTRDIIKREVAGLIGAGSVVRLFGSRVHDDQRGGDIDLLIESPQPIENRVKAECTLTARLYMRLGGRTVDVLIKDNLTPTKPIHQQAILYGVIL